LDSYWLDCGFRDQQELKAKLEAQEHRRCIKSHTPFDGIPYDPSVTYISIYRHPIDVHFSMMKHVENMKFDILDFLFPPEPGAAFSRFLTQATTDSGTDDLTLAAILHHYRSFARWAHLPNVHIFHYADLTRDFSGHIRRYAEAIGVSAPDALVAEISKAASFGAMKETTRAVTCSSSQGAFHVPHAFFDSASSDKWVGKLTEAELEAYRERCKALATLEEIRWLEIGDTAAEL
jgi:hypothetical protein